MYCFRVEHAGCHVNVTKKQTKITKKNTINVSIAVGCNNQKNCSIAFFFFLNLRSHDFKGTNAVH